jgi:hypothetical protein
MLVLLAEQLVDLGIDLPELYLMLLNSISDIALARILG